LKLPPGKSCLLKTQLKNHKDANRRKPLAAARISNKKTAVGFARSSATGQWSRSTEKSNCRFAVFSCTSIAPTTAAAEQPATPAASENPVARHPTNKKRRLKPFNHGRQPRRKTSIVVFAGLALP
jgi:hypothetical protein